MNFHSYYLFSSCQFLFFFFLIATLEASQKHGNTMMPSFSSIILAFLFCQVWAPCKQTFCLVYLSVPTVVSALILSRCSTVVFWMELNNFRELCNITDSGDLLLFHRKIFYPNFSHWCCITRNTTCSTIRPANVHEHSCPVTHHPFFWNSIDYIY